MGEVAATRTPLASEEIRPLLVQAWPGLSSQEVDYFLALILVETARGKSLIQWNFGNLSAGGIYNGTEKFIYQSYWRPPWYSDPSNPLFDRMMNGLAPSAFAAFGSAQSGMAAYVALLKSRGYAALRAAAAQDSPEAFVQALHDTGYSKDYGPKHVPTFRGIIREFRGTEPGQTGSVPTAGSLVLPVAGFVALVGAGAFALFRRFRAR